MPKIVKTEDLAGRDVKERVAGVLESIFHHFEYPGYGMEGISCAKPSASYDGSCTISLLTGEERGAVGNGRPVEL